MECDRSLERKDSSLLNPNLFLVNSILLLESMKSNSRSRDHDDELGRLPTISVCTDHHTRHIHYHNCHLRILQGDQAEKTPRKLPQFFPLVPTICWSSAYNSSWGELWTVCYQSKECITGWYFLYAHVSYWCEDQACISSFLMHHLSMCPRKFGIHQTTNFSIDETVRLHRTNAKGG